MRLLASALALSLIGLAAPTASACRIGPTPIPVAVWDQAPAPDQLRAGEVALEVVIPADANLAEPTDPNQVIVTSCNPEQRTLFRIVRVLSGDTRGAEFIVVPGWMIAAVIPIDPATGEPFEPVPPERWFVVGRLHAQSKYVASIFVDDLAAAVDAANATGRPLPALDARLPSQ